MNPGDLRGEAALAYETWRALGLSEAAAMAEAVGAEQEPFDQLVGLGRGLGLSESQARLFAVGRDGSEGEARLRVAEGGTRPAGGATVLSEAEQADLDARVRQAFGAAVDSAVRFARMSEAAAVRHVAQRAITALAQTSADLCQDSRGGRR